MVDGGEGNNGDTISYEGESATGVTLTSAWLFDDGLNMMNGNESDDGVLLTLRRALPRRTDMITVTRKARKMKLTIRSQHDREYYGGAGDDMLTGDDRDNTLNGRGGVRHA